MADKIQILFATNRKLLGMKGAVPDFGSDLAAAGAAGISCATATVEGTVVTDENSGQITAATAIVQGSFGQEDLKPILGSPNDILVFIHGTANDFQTAIERAAYNQKWLSQPAGDAGYAGRNYDVIAFTWPSIAFDFSGFCQDIGDIGKYEHDRDASNSSGAHIALFFQMLYDLRAKIGTRRMNMLCHSMGCYALGAAVEEFFARNNPAQPLFDEVMLAAGDEISTTFTTEKHGRLADLYRLGKEITVYFNRGDVAMLASRIINWLFHLGYDGPPNKADRTFFSPKVYEFVDCDGLRDYYSQSFDHTHQYYRESRAVRADIAVGLAGGTLKRPKYDAQGNFYSF